MVEGEPAGAEGLPEGGLALSLMDGLADVCVDAPVDGAAERLPEGLAAASPSDDELHAAMTTIPAIIHPTAHHRIPAPPSRCYRHQHARSRH
ncbi:hypothetical protein [Streptomyces sp. NPDC101149]|uniref:hypothetical protein n=1 Tax=Streptomyces sp. NPDC101149 TaxID=3366113 RepID=UPI0038171C28